MNKITLNKTQITPSKVACICRNFVDHIKELNNETPKEIVIFMKPNSAISNQIVFDNKDEIHYEGEISFVVEDGKLVAVGFGLDLTKRQIQSQLKSKGLPWERAKAFDGSAVFSDFVRFDGDIADIRMELYINGELIQAGGYDLMLYKPNEILADVNSFASMQDGDIIMTGTPKGVGKIKKGDKFIGKIYANDKLLVENSWVVN